MMNWDFSSQLDSSGNILWTILKPALNGGNMFMNNVAIDPIIKWSIFL